MINLVENQRAIETKILDVCIPIAALLGAIAIILKIIYHEGGLG